MGYDVLMRKGKSLCEIILHARARRTQYTTRGRTFRKYESSNRTFQKYEFRPHRTFRKYEFAVGYMKVVEITPFFGVFWPDFDARSMSIQGFITIFRAAWHSLALV